MPFALAITAGTVLAKHALAHGTPRTIAAIGLLTVAGGAALLAQASAGADFATDVLPGMAIIGLGVGMVFVPVSVTAMAGIPPQHAGMASGFLMTGHEVGAALGVAVLSAVASTAGGLSSAAGVVDGFPRGRSAAVKRADGGHRPGSRPGRWPLPFLSKVGEILTNLVDADPYRTRCVRRRRPEPRKR